MNVRKHPEVFALVAILAVYAVASLGEGRGYGHRSFVLADDEIMAPAPPKAPKAVKKLADITFRIEGDAKDLEQKAERLSRRAEAFGDRADRAMNHIERKLQSKVERLEKKVSTFGF